MFVGIDVSKDRLDVHLRPAAERFCLARGDTTGLQSEATASQTSARPALLIAVTSEPSQ